MPPAHVQKPGTKRRKTNAFQHKKGENECVPEEQKNKMRSHFFLLFLLLRSRRTEEKNEMVGDVC
jgi:hypothetical protein